MFSVQWGISSFLVIFVSFLFSAINRGWTMWSGWSDCDKSCEGGTQDRSRVCTSLKDGERQCEGDKIQRRVCNMQPCPRKYCDRKILTKIFELHWNLSDTISTKVFVCLIEMSSLWYRPFRDIPLNIKRRPDLKTWWLQFLSPNILMVKKKTYRLLEKLHQADILRNSIFQGIF